MSGDFWVKNFFLLIPLAICFSLSGCQTTMEESLIKPDFKQVKIYKKNSESGGLQLVDTRHKIRIDGNWYSANQDGTLTSKGAMELAQVNQGGGGGGGGGGC